MSSRHRSLALLVPAIVLAAPFLQAQVRISASKAHVESGKSLTLRAHPAEPGTNPAWEWAILSGGGQIQPGPDGKASFQAPVVTVKPVTVRIQVSDRAHPGSNAIHQIVVRPVIPGFPELLADVVLPAVLGPDYLFAVPTLSRFTPGANPMTGSGFLFQDVGQVRFIEPGTGLGALDGTWLVTDGNPWRRNAMAVSPQGLIVPVPAWMNEVTTFITRPRDSHPDNPHRLVFTERMKGSPGTLIRSMELDGTVRTLAGGPDADPMHPTVYREGKGTEARIGGVHGMAMDRDGTLYFCDVTSRVIRRLDTTGEVSLYAGRPSAHLPSPSQPEADGLANQVTFRGLSDLALDPATGELFVADLYTVRRVHQTKEGLRVDTILGGADRCTVNPVEDHPLVMTPGTSCFRSVPYGLHVSGRSLFIMDPMLSAIYVYNRDTRVMETLVDVSERGTWREGPLRLFCQRPASECATVGWDLAEFALNADGQCILASRHELFRMDLSAVFPGPMPRGASSSRDDSSSSTSSSSSSSTIP